MALSCTVNEEGVQHPDTSLDDMLCSSPEAPQGQTEAGPDEEEERCRHPRLLSTGLVAGSPSLSL